jgi:hypothetical protein
MEAVFAGSQHLSFGHGAINGLTGTPVPVEHFAYYTRAWFDLFLRHERTAVSRLLATRLDGTASSEVLSTKFISAAYLPQEHVYCPNLRACGVGR